MVVSGSSRIRFAIDSSGNYGYKKVGADTVTPFKNPTGTLTLTAATSGTDCTDYAKVVTSGLVKPSGTKTITSNGTVDVSSYASASVSVANSNSGTYTPTSRAASLDMGATNSYRYVNTNSVPNSNSGTYTYASGSTGGTVDLGATNTYRYVNASNVYNKGKSDGTSLSYGKSYIFKTGSGVSSGYTTSTAKNNSSTAASITGSSITMKAANTTSGTAYTELTFTLDSTAASTIASQSPSAECIYVEFTSTGTGVTSGESVCGCFYNSSGAVTNKNKGCTARGNAFGGEGTFGIQPATNASFSGTVIVPIGGYAKDIAVSGSKFTLDVQQYISGSQTGSTLTAVITNIYFA